MAPFKSHLHPCAKMLRRAELLKQKGYKNSKMTRAKSDSGDRPGSALGHRRLPQGLGSPRTGSADPEARESKNSSKTDRRVRVEKIREKYRERKYSQQYLFRPELEEARIDESSSGNSESSQTHLTGAGYAAKRILA